MPISSSRLKKSGAVLRHMSQTLCVTHRFEDAFTLVVPADVSSELDKIWKAKARMEWLKGRNWLLIDERSNTGQQLREWMRRQGSRIEPTMQLDNFDLIINLVSLGLGISFERPAARAALHSGTTW